MLQSSCCHYATDIAAQDGNLFILIGTSHNLHGKNQRISCEAYSLLLHFLDSLHLLLQGHVVVHKSNASQLQPAKSFVMKEEDVKD